MIDRKNKMLSKSRQCSMLDVNRSSLYYDPRPIEPEDIELMRLIDEQYMKTLPCCKCNKRGHYANKCFKRNTKRKINELLLESKKLIRKK